MIKEHFGDWFFVILASVILVGSAVVYAQETETPIDQISEEVTIENNMPGDLELAKKVVEIMASSTLSDIEASKIAYTTRNDHKVIELLTEIRDLIKHIDVAIPR